MSIADLQTELARLSPVGDDGGTLAKIEGDFLIVGWVESIGVEMHEPVAFPIDDADKLAAILRTMPEGCPVAEGEDGSLWEVLLEAQDSMATARAYIIDHHGVLP